MLDTIHVESPVGPLTLVASHAGLRAVLWDNDRPGRVEFETVPHPREGNPFLQQVAAQLGEYFAGERREFSVDLDPAGTEFQKRVWKALAAIPYGTTTTYGEIARGLGNPAAGRAVGAAIGRNPLSIVVPCHRVVGADGSLTGFAGGTETKSWLLGHEQGVRATA